MPIPCGWISHPQRAVLLLFSQCVPALAPQVDPIDLTFDHLEISVKSIDSRIVEEQIRHGITADQGERLVSTPARRLPPILDPQIERACGATCLEEFVHGHHGAAARP